MEVDAELPLSSSPKETPIKEPPPILRAVRDQHDCGICHQAINNADKKDHFSAGGFKKGDDDKSDEWIQCNCCNRWFHIACAKVEEFETKLIDIYHCSDCIENSGKSIIMKKNIVPHRYKFWKESEKDKPDQVGTKPWIDKLIAREAKFPEFSDLKLYENGYEFTNNFNYNEEWKQPLKVLKKEGLNMHLPDGDFTIDTIVDLVGRDEEIQVIDVYMQESNTMSMGAFYDRWKDENRERLYNMLSFEFSHTRLMDIVRAPDLMYKLSWVHRFWPPDGVSTDDYIVIPEHVEFKPDVAMFCLLGMGGSYTDFHIDFGGSSVWYHVYKGKKVFYVIQPTEKTLEKFVEWTNGPNRSEKDLNDLMPEGLMKRVEINEGETLMIPSGWIHAVYTPIDSIVFGGNFIHELNITRQLQVYDVELKCSYDDHFLFPSFELTNWYAAFEALERFGSLGNDSLSQHVIEGFRSLGPYLKKWVQRDKEQNENYKLPNIFRDTIADLDKMIDQYDKSCLDEAYDPENEKKSSLKIKLKMNGSGSNSPKKREKSFDKLSKKDGKYVKNIFKYEKTNFGRTLKPSERIKKSVVGFESEPGPSSNSNKNFFDNFSPEERKQINDAAKADDGYVKSNGDIIYSSSDDEDITSQISKKKRKYSTKTKDTPKEPKPPKIPKPQKAANPQARMLQKMKLLKKKK
uniref:JmjC domain-containing protein n=1 Tax=Panagrolaimus davidi TaxID=227884 RepID=A0A914QIS3_9BILA